MQGNAEFGRPQGWRFTFGGVSLNGTPDSITYPKFASAQNIRSTLANSVQTRPGYSPFFSCNNAAVTDIRAYATLETDDKPRFLARDTNNVIYLDNVGFTK